jgi:hypothetical protein
MGENSESVPGAPAVHPRHLCGPRRGTRLPRRSRSHVGCCAPAMHPEGVGQTRQPRVSDALKAQAPPWVEIHPPDEEPRTGFDNPGFHPRQLLNSTRTLRRIRFRAASGTREIHPSCPTPSGLSVETMPLRPRVASRAVGALLTLGSEPILPLRGVGVQK